MFVTNCDKATDRQDHHEEHWSCPMQVAKHHLLASPDEHIPFDRWGDARFDCVFFEHERPGSFQPNKGQCRLIGLP